MPFSWDDMPYTNFHELNLDWFINKFKEIFEEWASLYNQLTTWKDATDAELDAWKTAQESQIAGWEAATIAALDVWKGITETSIESWETATLTALDAWKTAAETAFEAIRVEAAASATAAAGSATDAETAKIAAIAAQTAAETAAASVRASAMQIAINTDNIDNLETQLTNKVPYPVPPNSKYGNDGQFLRSKGDGNTEWVNPETPTSAEVKNAVYDWMNDNPDDRALIEDGSITKTKLANSLKLETIKDYVTPQMYGAVGDGIEDDTLAIQALLDANYNRCVIVFPKGSYKVTAPLTVPNNINRVLYYFYESSIICAHTGDGLRFTQSDSEQGHCKFVNMKIVGPNPSFSTLAEKTSEGVGVKITSGYHNVFDNCYIAGFKYGLTINTGIGNTFTNDCYIRFNEYGIIIGGNAANMNRFLGCSIRENWITGITIDGTDATSIPMLNEFCECLIESNIPYSTDDRDDTNGIAIYLNKTTGNIFSNCYFENHRRSIILDALVTGNKFLFNRYVNNIGSLIEFNGINTVKNIFVYNSQDSATEYNSIIVSTNYSNLIANDFNNCYGFVLNNRTSHTNFPRIYNCKNNVTYNGNIFDKAHIGSIYQNPGIVEISVNPHIYNGVLYTAGYGCIQFGNAISSDVQISSVDGLQKGDIIVIEGYNLSHKIEFINGTTLALKNSSCTISSNYDTLVLYCDYLGRIVEITRNTEGLKTLTVTPTIDVSSSGTGVRMMNNIVVISVDVVMDSVKSDWVDILTVSNCELLAGSYFVVAGTGETRYCQPYMNNGVFTIRMYGCTAIRYRGECVAFAK